MKQEPRMQEESSPVASRRLVLIVVGALLLVAVCQRAWNAYSMPPLTGYDVPGHAG